MSSPDQPQPNLTQDEATVLRTVGPQTFLRGQQCAGSGAVVRVQWHEHAARVFGEVRGTARLPYTALADVRRTSTGALTGFRGSCTCPVGVNCKHAVALLLAAMADVGAATASWEQSLATVISAPPAGTDETPRIGLQFELTEGSAQRGGPGPNRALALRPVVPGRTGNWVRTGISWSGVGYSARGGSRHAAHLRLLGEILALSSSVGYSDNSGYQNRTIQLDEMPSRRIWDLLAEAGELGLPLVCAGTASAPVRVAAERATVSLDVRRSPDGLEVAARITIGAEQALPAASLLLGDPAHGIAWWQTPDEPESAPADRRLRLAALSGPVGTGLRTLLTRDALHIPPGDEERFLREYYPRLRQAVPVLSTDSSVALPEPERPVLVLQIAPSDAHQVRFEWYWSYGESGEYGEPDRARREPLWPVAGSPALRDSAAEGAVLAAVTEVVADVPVLLDDSRHEPCIAPARTVTGIAAVTLATQVLPRLAELPDVTVVGADALPAYRESEAAPLIAITGEQHGDDRDWFDLAVTVSVDGEDVPFEQLFVALAADDQYLILPSGTFFSLDRDEFVQLAALIAEARALHDAPGGTVRVSRFQAGLWDELQRVGVISGQAAAWQQTVRALCDGELSRQPLPDALHATPRPYQRTGFDWLAFLYANGLGGVLADDMGLGKTLQALALMAHVREQQPAGAPFLVVAPTSVVSNWAAECRKFTPDLRAVMITGTRARRGIDLDEIAADTDVVITSYTLFRLEYDDYATINWAGLMLDEAQFVKNHQSQGYQCAKRLPTPFKLAITGTPMENNLMELWSLLSITAPGLFASPTRFERYYRTPIEKMQDPTRLTQLRHRIRPLMLRRTKEQVLTELPDKQEQVLELELNSKHRKVYQTHLQRERQKVLGLLGDFERNRFEIFRSLTLLRQASLHAALVDPEYARIPSTKLDVLMELLGDVITEGHRVLVFSQFTRFLDAARQRLDGAGIEHCYLDGRTRQRAAVLERFKSGRAPVFLVSLKAGGFGLNLAEADYCILLDPWWNPATEAQAVDRVHRIGQTRKVMVYRLVAKDTIEEKVMALKAAKAALFSSVLSADGPADAALTAADIRGLLD